MDDLSQRAQDIAATVKTAAERLSISEGAARLQILRDESARSDFWNDAAHAQDVMKQISKLETKVTPWLILQEGLTDTLELIHLHDRSLEADLQQQVSSYEADYENLKETLKFSGKYDDFDAILSLHAGAGGTDAQDWAQMLLRMYVRWAEANDCTVTTIDESAGEEAGIKSVTIEISGVYAYGKLKGEHGVHRLVRLSPFNSDNLRQTGGRRAPL